MLTSFLTKFSRLFISKKELEARDSRLAFFIEIYQLIKDLQRIDLRFMIKDEAFLPQSLKTSHHREKVFSFPSKKNTGISYQLSGEVYSDENNSSSFWLSSAIIIDKDYETTLILNKSLPELILRDKKNKKIILTVNFLLSDDKIKGSYDSKKFISVKHKENSSSKEDAMLAYSYLLSSKDSIKELAASYKELSEKNHQSIKN